jgi:hypothetical protein
VRLDRFEIDEREDLDSKWEWWFCLGDESLYWDWSERIGVGDMCTSLGYGFGWIFIFPKAWFRVRFDFDCDTSMGGDIGSDRRWGFTGSGILGWPSALYPKKVGLWPTGIASANVQYPPLPPPPSLRWSVDAVDRSILMKPALKLKQCRTEFYLLVWLLWEWLTFQVVISWCL